MLSSLSVWISLSLSNSCLIIILIQTKGWCHPFHPSSSTHKHEDFQEKTGKKVTTVDLLVFFFFLFFFLKMDKGKNGLVNNLQMKKKSMSCLEEQDDDELEEEVEEEVDEEVIEESESDEEEDVDLFLILTTFLIFLSPNNIFLSVWTSRNPHLGQIDFSEGRLDRKEIHFQ